jgi:hypothetical protein
MHSSQRGAKELEAIFPLVMRQVGDGFNCRLLKWEVQSLHKLSILAVVLPVEVSNHS